MENARWQSLAARRRGDAGHDALRLQLVLAEVARANSAYDARVYQAATDAAAGAAARAAPLLTTVAASG